MKNRDAERAREALADVKDRCGNFVKPLKYEQIRVILAILGDAWPYQIIHVVSECSDETIKRELQLLGDETLQIQIGDYIFWFSPAHDYYSVSYSQRDK